MAGTRPVADDTQVNEIRFDRKKIKYPYIYSDKNGKTYKCSYELAKVLFG